MTETKNARSDAATSEQANERASTDTSFSNKFNTNRLNVQGFLLEGEANAMPMRELARLVSVSERQV